MKNENLRKMPEKFAKTMVKRSGFVPLAATLLMAGCFPYLEGKNLVQTPATSTSSATSSEPIPTLVPIPTPKPEITEKSADRIINDLEAQIRITRELDAEACKVAAQLAAESIGYDNLVRIAKLAGQPTPQAPNPCEEAKQTPTPTATPSLPTPTPYVPFTAQENINEIPIGIKSDSFRGTCDIVDIRTGTTVTGLQAPAQLHYEETGVGEKNDKYLTAKLKPGQYALFQGFLVERRKTDRFVFGPGAYVIVEADSQKTKVEYFVSSGAVSIFGNKRDAMIGLCIGVQEAVRNKWDHNSVVYPESWNFTKK